MSYTPPREHYAIRSAVNPPRPRLLNVHAVLPDEIMYSCDDDVSCMTKDAFVYSGPFMYAFAEGSIPAMKVLVDIVGSDAVTMYVPGGTVTFCVSSVP